MSNSSARMSARIREAIENRRVSLAVGVSSRENPETSNAARIIASVNTNVTTTARASTSRNNPIPRNTTSGINRRTAASQHNPVSRNTSTSSTRRTSTAASASPQIRSTSGRSAATSTLPRATTIPRTPAAASTLPQIRSTSGRSALTGARSRSTTIRNSQPNEVPRPSVKKNEKKRADKQVQTEKSDEVFSLPVTKRDRSLSPTQLPCAVCFNELLPNAGRRLTSLKCGHTFCRPCVDKWYEICKFCPLCMQPMNKKSFRNIFF